MTLLTSNRIRVQKEISHVEKLIHGSHQETTVKIEK